MRKLPCPQWRQGRRRGRVRGHAWCLQAAMETTRMFAQTGRAAKSTQHPGSEASSTHEARCEAEVSARRMRRKAWLASKVKHKPASNLSRSCLTKLAVRWRGGMRDACCGCPASLLVLKVPTRPRSPLARLCRLPSPKLRVCCSVSTRRRKRRKWNRPRRRSGASSEEPTRGTS